jgi:hypothetical protein
MLRFLLDEHLRGVLWLAIQRHNARGGLPIDAVRVGDPLDLPLGSDDPSILLWAEREGRILLTQDVSTMPGFLNQHLQAGHHSPGVFMITIACSIAQLIGYFELVSHAGNSVDYKNAITYVP